MKWTQDEIELLRKLYPTHRTIELETVFGRSKNLIIRKANSIGLYKKSNHNTIVYRGCNKDCFNCPYPDCLAPYEVCKEGIGDSVIGEEIT